MASYREYKIGEIAKLFCKDFLGQEIKDHPVMIVKPITREEYVDFCKNTCGYFDIRRVTEPYFYEVSTD
jgi:hypothetical protein